ncbi:copper homeostasis membrane protein CopD [Dickeya zeae]|uniref:copper homeostasis membrane protein CopD n=1 Tax=Dickeya zeae TaxID=204042 RepID=UPI002096B3B3|nr:copper homeostasis membrane protein CopD [Dickeya zeae]MCO7262001.1 copper homeostasis membrane protein CopD [Dickeya zeae]
MLLEAVYAALRIGHFSSLMLLVGATCYCRLLSPQTYRAQLALRLSGVMVFSSIVAVLTAVGILAAQTGLMSGDWRNIGDVSTWYAVLGTRFGMLWVWQPVLALITCVMVFWRCAGWLSGVLMSGVAQLCGMAWVGHAAMLEGWPGVVHGLSQTVHLLSVTFWVGGLAPLLPVLRDAQRVSARDDAILTMMRFSRFGHLAVALAILTGLVNARLILGWPLPPFGVYSTLLAVKVLLVAAMVLLALFNRYWVVPRFHHAGHAAYGYFLRLTIAELLLSVLVVGLVSVLATLSPA